MKKIFTILGSTLLLSCTLSKPQVSSNTIDSSNTNTIHSENTVQKEDNYNVTIKIQQYHPYCGGAAPGPDQLNNYSNYGGELILTNIISGEKSSLFSKNGVYQTYLDKGTYTIKEKYKDVSFEEFVKNNSRDGEYYTGGTEECYKMWWESNLFNFKVTSVDTLINLETSIGSSCFTGNNPCIQYTGPYPP